MMHPSTPSTPPPGADLRALRARLLEKLSAVKAYFEATSINLNLRSPYWGAFDALRRNQPLAESFVNDLQQLLNFLDNDLAPVLTSLQSAGAQAPPPATSAWRSAEPVSPTINEDQTRLLSDLAVEQRRELPGTRSSGRGLAAPIIDMDARLAPAPAPAPAPPPRSRGAEVRAALLPEFDVETSPIELLPEPVTSRAAPAVRGQVAPKEPKAAAPAASPAGERGRRTAATPAVPTAPVAAAPEPAPEPALSPRAAALAAVVTPDPPARSESPAAAPLGRPSQLNKIISLPAVPQTSSIVTSVSATTGTPRLSTQHKIISTEPPPAAPPAASAAPAASKPTTTAPVASPAPTKAEAKPAVAKSVVAEPVAKPSASKPAVESKPAAAAPVVAKPTGSIPVIATPAAATAPAASASVSGSKATATPVAAAPKSAAATPSTAASSPAVASKSTSPAASKPLAAVSTSKPEPLAPAVAAPAASPGKAAASKPVEAVAASKPSESKGAGKPAATAPTGAALASKPVAAAKPVAEKAPAKASPAAAKPAASAMPGKGAKKKQSVLFDESDVSQPGTQETPSQFFRLLDAKLDDDE